MNLRKHLSDIISRLDNYPQIKTDKIEKPVITALKKFEEKFNIGVEDLAKGQAADEIKSRLVRMEKADALSAISRLKEDDLTALCQLLKIKAKATKKLSARQNADAKLAKAIDGIRKQIY